MAKSGDPRLNRAYRYKFRNQVLARDSYTCYYCGADADQVDHVIPISKAVSYTHLTLPTKRIV